MKLLDHYDPELRAAKKAVRAAVVVPGSFALGEATGDPQVAVFALFGAFALTLMVDLTAPTSSRRRGYLLLASAGYLLIPVGTLCSRQPVAAVLVMAIVAFLVLFGSLASPLLAQATPVSLLMLVLPVCLPAGPAAIGPRLLGFTLAAAVSVPAVLFVWPTPDRHRLRQGLAEAADALAAMADSHAAGHSDPSTTARSRTACQSLTEVFEQTAYLPTGAAPGDDALWRLVSQLRRVEEELAIADHAPAGVLSLDQVRAMSADAAQVLRAAASALREGPGADSAALSQALAAMVRQRDRSIVEAVDRLVAESQAPTPGPAAGAPATPSDHGPGCPTATATGTVQPSGFLIDTLDPTFRSRLLGHVLEVVGTDVLAATTSPGQTWPARARGLAQGARSRLASHASLESVWLRNSLRGAVGLALAVLVVQVTDVQHGFWVVLGTLSILRTNASGTTSTAARAVVGTVVGVVIGSALVWATGATTPALWALLPLVVLAAGFASAAISFAAGQTAFTMTVLVAFHILQPVGWQLGLVRAEDVAIGGAVALGVGLLLWPRGASRALGSALCQALVDGAGYLAAALDRIMAPGYDTDVSVAEGIAVDAVRRLDEAFRVYLLERGAKTVDATSLTTLFVSANQLQVSGELLAKLPVRPLVPADLRTPSIEKAQASLRQAYAATRRWYQEAGECLAGRGPGAPPLPDAPPALRRGLLEAFREAVGTGPAGPVRMLLRMLWADQALEEIRRLQLPFIDAVTSFATRPTWWGWRRRLRASTPRRAAAEVAPGSEGVPAVSNGG